LTEEKREVERGGAYFPLVTLLNPYLDISSVPLELDAVEGAEDSIYRYGKKGGETYPESCLSKDDFPGKSLLETVFPVDSLFSLASL
jgi:hypothetical protein